MTMSHHTWGKRVHQSGVYTDLLCIKNVFACKMKWRKIFLLFSSFCFSSLTVTYFFNYLYSYIFSSRKQTWSFTFLETKIYWITATKYHDFSSQQAYCHGKAHTCGTKMVIRASNGNNWCSDEYINFEGNMWMFGSTRRRF
jgi:hypothetical protein